MAKKFVRSLKDVKDIQQLSKNIIEENDIVSTEEGKVYIVTKTDFIEIGGSGVDIADLKSSVTTLKTDVTTNQSDVDTLKTDVSTLQGQATDFEKRIKALETINVTGVKLDKTTLSLEVGATATLKATVSPDNASYKAVKFTSSDDAIATVDDKGKVTAVKAGTADITVESLADGSKTAKCTLTVTEPPKEEEPPTE